MEDRFANRMGMFQTALGVLNSSENKPIWENQAPLIFTTKVAEAQAAIGGLQQFIAQHSVDITGAAADKAQEKRELEDAIFSLSQAMVCWFRDRGDETSAAQVDRSISGWRRLREQELIAQATIARDLAQSVVDGPDAAAAADYGITAAAVASVTAELDEFQAVVTAPQEKIASRKALTAQFRERFNEVEAKFEVLDALILQYGTTEAGRSLIAAYQAGRIVRDLGSGGSPPGPPPPPSGLPEALEIDQLVQSGSNIDVIYAAGGGTGATSLTLLWQVVGMDPDFDNSTEATPPQQTIGPFNPGLVVRVKTRAANAAGSVESAVAEISMT